MPCNPNQINFKSEGYIRSKSINAARESGAVDGDLFMFSDLDEIPRLETIKMLKLCDFGIRINLALNSFRYFKLIKKIFI